MAVAVVAASRVLPDSERRDDLTFDLWGGLFLAAGIAAILIPLNRANALGWSHPIVAGGLVAAPLLLAAFVLWERRTDHPLIELSVLRERNVALPLLSQIFLNGPYMAGLVITSLMLGATSTFAYSTTAISLLILPRPIMFAIGAWMAGWLTDRFGGRPVVMLGCTGISAGLLAIGLGAVAGNVGFVIAGVGVAGAGSGIARPPIIAALTDAVGDRDLGVGTGMLNMAGQIGAAAGISLLSALVADDSTPERFRLVFVIGAAVSTLAIGVAGAIRFTAAGPTPKPTPSPTAPYSATVAVREDRPTTAVSTSRSPDPTSGRAGRR